MTTAATTTRAKTRWRWGHTVYFISLKNVWGCRLVLSFTNTKIRIIKWAKWAKWQMAAQPLMSVLLLLMGLLPFSNYSRKYFSVAVVAIRCDAVSGVFLCNSLVEKVLRPCADLSLSCYPDIATDCTGFERCTTCSGPRLEFVRTTALNQLISVQ